MSEGLNPQQREAVRYIDGPLLVLAGAGSGKTRVITQKIAYLIEHCEYSASSIAAVTFSNKAAREMQQRLSGLVPPKQRRGLTVSTFHALGLSILKREALLCGLKPGFSIFDTDDCLQILKGIMPPAFSQDRAMLMQVLQQFSQWKTGLSSPESLLKNDPEAGYRYQRYQDVLRTYNAVDFDDLLALPVALFEQNSERLIHWQQRFRHILVDEYQDSNTSQYQLLKALIGDRARFTAVGDDDQSIYAWRGAQAQNLSQLRDDFPGLKVITLEQNYRSTGRILQAANHLITHNPQLFPKRLWSEYGPGEMIRIFSCKSEQDEAELMVGDLLSHQLRHRRQWRDYAILYRSNHQSRLFEKVLRAHRIPYHLSGGQSWFAKAEIKDCLAYLKLLCHQEDDPAFLRAVSVPKRGIGEATLNKLGDYAKSRGQSLLASADHLALMDQLPAAARASLQAFKKVLYHYSQRLEKEPVRLVLRELIEDIGYAGYCFEEASTPQQAQKRLDNVMQLIDWVANLLEKHRDYSLADALHTLMLIDRLDKEDDSDDDVLQLMTLHAAKGLEFPFVYLVGMEEGILPHLMSEAEEQIQEERRLAYVGITRAQQMLTLSMARLRRRGGQILSCSPSRFLAELPQDTLEWLGREGERDPVKSKALASSHLASLKQLLEPD